MLKAQTVSILQRLHSDKQAAANFVRDPAAEWHALGGQLPAGVTPAQFAQRVRGGELFKSVQATANGQISAMAWSPCQMGVMFLFDTLGVTAGFAVTVASGGAAEGIIAAIAAFAGANVSVVTAAFSTLGQAPLAFAAAAICHGA
ncbi:MAG TPA: hypothetical protein VGG29_12600 [Caulobacteraceae bacterium]